jgi:hypothetical protein
MQAAFEYIANANGYRIEKPKSLDYEKCVSSEQNLQKKHRVFDYEYIRTLFKKMIDIY